MTTETSCNCCADQISMCSSKVEFPVLVHVFAAICGVLFAGGIQSIFHPSHAASLVLVFVLGTALTLVISAIVWAVQK